MGYYIYQRETDLYIKKENFQKALKLLLDFAKKHQIEVADNEEIIKGCLNQDIVSALSEARFDPEFEDGNAESDICALWYNGEKTSDEDEILACLAPVVENGSYITFSGENDDLWRYVFEDGEMYEVSPTTIWPKAKHGQVIKADIEAIKKSGHTLIDGRLVDADTVLADILDNQDNEVTGLACEVFDCWEKADDKRAVENLFNIITGVSFDEYLKMCKQNGC